MNNSAYNFLYKILWFVFRHKRASNTEFKKEKDHNRNKEPGVEMIFSKFPSLESGEWMALQVQVCLDVLLTACKLRTWHIPIMHGAYFIEQTSIVFIIRTVPHEVWVDIIREIISEEIVHRLYVYMWHITRRFFFYTYYARAKYFILTIITAKV